MKNKLIILLIIFSSILLCYRLTNSLVISKLMVQETSYFDINNNISLRKMPFPYRNMFSIINDADENDKKKFEGMHKFLNTLSNCGSLGLGVGLDIGDTFFMGEIGSVNNEFEDSNQWYFWNTDTKIKIDGKTMEKYINAGWIDIPHTFFSYAHTNKSTFSRKKAIDVISEWKSFNFKPILWVDHWDNPWNIMTSDQKGAVISSQYYCSDLAMQAGIKAFWLPIIPPKINKSTNYGRLGFDTCLIPIRLPDNKMVWGFLRNYEEGQTNNTWLGKVINRELYGDKLSNFKPANKDTYIVIASHMGYADSDGLSENNKYTLDTDLLKVNGGKWFNDETVKALRDLKEKQNNGEILVTNASRLTRYNLVNDMLSKYNYTSKGYTVGNHQGTINIVINNIYDDCFGVFTPTVDDLRGITFYCDDPVNTKIFINETPIDSSQLQLNNADYTGKKSISIKWYEPDYKDYTNEK